MNIRWATEGNETARFRLTCTERGGPVMMSLVRRGLGTKLAERGLEQDRGGTVRIAFAPEGVTRAVEAPPAGMAAAELVPFLRVGSSGGN